MNYTLTGKSLHVTPSTVQVIEHYRAKLQKALPTIAGKTPQLRITLREELHQNAYICSIELGLPHKRLQARATEYSIHRALSQAFFRLAEQVKVYKARHFTSSPKYPNQFLPKRDWGMLLNQ
jgi:ribosome-associated translation inhibitor RaiA